VAPTSAFPALGVKEDDFPDLAAAAKVKETRKDKKKKATKQVLSLNEFLKSDVGGGGPLLGAGRRGGDVDILSLPTAPRPRAEGEERPDRPLGGGFREYGGREGEAANCRDAEMPACQPSNLGSSTAIILHHSRASYVTLSSSTGHIAWRVNARSLCTMPALCDMVSCVCRSLDPQAGAVSMTSAARAVAKRRTWAPHALR
jgi:hypothetical protein